MKPAKSNGMSEPKGKSQGEPYCSPAEFTEKAKSAPSTQGGPKPVAPMSMPVQEPSKEKL